MSQAERSRLWVAMSAASSERPAEQKDHLTTAKRSGEGCPGLGEESQTLTGGGRLACWGRQSDSHKEEDESGEPVLASSERGYEKETAGFPLELEEDATDERYRGRRRPTFPSS